MAKDCSFDIVSEFDKQELVNAVDQVKRELSTRFDLKDSNSDVILDTDKTITITTNDDMKLRNIIDILQSKMIKRNLSIKILDPQSVENALGGNVRQVFNLKKGLTQELSKKIVADIKNTKLKVQASIQGEQVRVSGKDKDDLQAVIKMLRDNADNYTNTKQKGIYEVKEIRTVTFIRSFYFIDGKCGNIYSITYCRRNKRRDDKIQRK